MMLQWCAVGGGVMEQEGRKPGRGCGSSGCVKAGLMLAGWVTSLWDGACREYMHAVMSTVLPHCS